MTEDLIRACEAYTAVAFAFSPADRDLEKMSQDILSAQPKSYTCALSMYIYAAQLRIQRLSHSNEAILLLVS